MKEEWIENKNGVCPVKEGTMIDVKYAGGDISRNVKALLPPDQQEDPNGLTAEHWYLSGSDYDIEAYRLSDV